VLVAKVDSLLATGESYRTISALTGVDRFAIQRHKRHSGAQPEAEPELSELELSDKRLAALSDQLEAQYAAALAVSDQKLAVEVLKTRSRIEGERHKRIVTRGQKETDDDNDKLKEWPTILQATNVKRKVDESHARAIANGAIMCPLCNARPVSLEQIQYFRSHDEHASS
jgi:hypothetical protein